MPGRVVVGPLERAGEEFELDVVVVQVLGDGQESGGAAQAFHLVHGEDDPLVGRAAGAAVGGCLHLQLGAELGNELEARGVVLGGDLAAARITVPVEFLVQWDDERVPRVQSLALFDALASAEKTLHANPGKHGEIPAFELESTLRFFARHLG
ncbi:hypothetical protein SUDANB151_00858 [Streptomyces sp. enrichment culture]